MDLRETENIECPDTHDGAAFAELPDLSKSGTEALEAWFLGPKGENAGELEALVLEALRDHVYWRRNFHPGDPTHITEGVKRQRDFLLAQDRLKENFRLLLSALKKSVPFFSMRYQGHMNSDLTLPGIAGYFAAMLYNPNNVAFEGSTATTILEMRVADDICKMLGYGIPSRQEEDTTAKAPRPWGHLTCDGTVANIEALWSTRNVKFYSVAIQAALKELAKQEPYANAVGLDVTLCNGATKRLVQLDPWELVNISCDETLTWPERLETEFQVPSETLTREVKAFAVQEIGMYEFGKQFFGCNPMSPVVLVSGTKHYSFPKAMALLGLGADNLVNVPVDEDARMNTVELERLLREYSQKRTPVLAVVSVMGSTEESAVDPLTSILDLRRRLRTEIGLDFNVHADGAWGGYHVCTIRDDADVGAELEVEELFTSAFVGEQAPTVPLSGYVQKQLEHLRYADSITVDPHKSGYIPYPAGALCYRNSGMPQLVSFSAPYILHGSEPTVGIFGVEGSKPGAAAASVFLSHSIIRPSESGYGKIIGEALKSCKKLYCRVLTMAKDKDDFICVPVPRLPAERPGGDPNDIDEQKLIIKEIDRKTKEGVALDPYESELLCEVGPDQNILTYSFNFKINGRANTSLTKLNAFNKRLYDHLSIERGKDIYDRALIVSTTDFTEESYGKVFIDAFKDRLGVEPSDETSITVLRSVVMDPWLTETRRGSARISFLDILEAEFRNVIVKVLSEPAFSSHNQPPTANSQVPHQV